MMRVADRAVARNYLKYLHKSQAKYSETNKRLASGNRFTKLSDDVSAGSRVLRSRMDRYKAEKQLDNTKEAADELTIAEDALTSINTLIMYIHEQKVVKALNDPTSEEGRKILAQEIQAMMDEIVQHANAKYGNKYSFGGTNSYTAPFTIGANGKMLYNGIPMDEIREELDDAGHKTGRYVYYTGGFEMEADGVTPKLDADGNPIPAEAVVPLDKEIYFDTALGVKINIQEKTPGVPFPEFLSGTAFKISYSGPEVFGFGVDEKGLSNNIYNVLAEVKKYVEDFDRPSLEKWHTKLGSLLSSFRSRLTDIGVKTNFLNDNVKRLEDVIDNHTAKIYDLMGVDDAEEATNQMMNDYVLKAILQLGSRVLPLSLMDFIR